MHVIYIEWAFPRTRARELSKILGAKLYGINVDMPIGIKYIISFIKTILILFKEKPDTIIIQIPPIFIAIPIYCYTRIFGGKYLLDVHSGEIVDYKWKPFKLIRKFFFVKATLVLLHNKSNYKLVKDLRWNCRCIILNDPIPEIVNNINPIRNCSNCKNIIVISTFDKNEPFYECLEAINILLKRWDGDNWVFTFTGDNSKIKIEDKNNNNIIFTGFMDYEKYWSVLKGADVIVSLNKRNSVITCGLWEGISLNKPVVTNNYEVIKELFNDNLIYTDNTSLHIANAIQKAYIERNSISSRIKVEKEIMKINWIRKFSIIKNSFNK
jgi:glycosyltransferase involved in cell wall biosynthesis